MTHGSTFRLWLERSKGRTRVTVIDSPKHPRGSTYVALMEKVWRMWSWRGRGEMEKEKLTVVHSALEGHQLY